jgi:hypothetical protein
MSDERSRTDGELLAEFAATGSDNAFAALVQRHGGMVQATCRRVLADIHEAQVTAQVAARGGRLPEQLP